MALGGTRGASFYSFTPNDQIFENMSTFKTFMSDFSFLCNRARPCGTQNRIESDNYEFATQLRVHHQGLTPRGRLPIITGNRIVNIRWHAKIYE